ncbi:MAG: hypothetical protein ACRDZW_04700, partial [Acidimicrobiales bacterium]
ASHLAGQGRGLRYQEALRADLDQAVDGVGGAARVLACGQPFTGPYTLPAVAWRLGVHLADVRYFRFEPGAVLRSSPELGAPADPAVLPPELGYRTVIGTGTWEIRAACRPGHDLTTTPE